MSFKRGTFYLFFAWGFWVLAAYVMNAWLARQFSPEVIGSTYGLVMSILWWIEIVVINGMPYTLQKFIPGNENNALSILKSGLRIQAMVGVVLFGVVFAASPMIAAAFRSPSLAWIFRIAFIDIPLLGLFHIFVAYQNGMKHFGRQAVLFMVYAAGRLVFLILFVSVFKSIAGALMANAAGSFAGLIVGVVFLLKGRRRDHAETYEHHPVRPMIRFAVPSLFYFLMLHLFFFVDFWTVKINLTDQASGFYYVASLIARVPFFVFLGLSATLLPTIAGGLHSGRLDSVRSTIKLSFKILLLFSAPILMFMTLFSTDVVSFVYGADYAPGGEILRILIWSITLLTFLSILTTIINADNRPSVSFAITAVCIAVDIALNIAMVPRWGVIGGAAATTIAVGMGCVAGIGIVHRRFKTIFDLRSVMRIALSMAGMGIACFVLRRMDLHFLIIGIIGGSVYMGMLVIMKEITAQDLFSLQSGGVE